MSEKNVKKTEEVVETAAEETAVKKTTAAKKPAEKTEKKKENIFKRGHKKVKAWMSEHPGITLLGGTALGVAGTVAVGEVGRRVSERRNATPQDPYPQDDRSPLDPNV